MVGDSPDTRKEQKMPFVVNKSQQLLKAAVYPISAYSRVVSCNCWAVTIGGWTGSWTTEVGNRVWLQRVQVKLDAKALDPLRYTQFRIITGTIAPKAIADLWTWENILPLWDGGDRLVEWEAYPGTEDFDWTMSVLYKGEHRRFGVLASTGVNEQKDLVRVSFQIAEG